MLKIESIHPPAHPAVAPKPVDQLEQAFLEEMLKYALPRPEGDFSGGPGEEQFSGFLTQNYAALLAQRLDLGFDRGDWAMHRSIERKLAQLKSAIIAGRSAQALAAAGDLEAKLAGHGIRPEEIGDLERRLQELRSLAEAAGRGALLAIEDVKAILSAGHSVRSYDRHGRRRDDSVQDQPARRF